MDQNNWSADRSRELGMNGTTITPVKKQELKLGTSSGYAKKSINRKIRYV